MTKFRLSQAFNPRLKVNDIELRKKNGDEKEKKQIRFKNYVKERIIGVTTGIGN